MEMNQIKYALAAADKLNFTKAAQACNVSQPALTQAIKTLEAQLGTPIFYREGKRIQLSDFGRSILPLLQRIQDDALAAKTFAKNYQLLDQTPVRLGVMTTIGHAMLARFVSQFNSTCPRIELAISEDSISRLSQQLEEDELDAVIVNPLNDLPRRFNLHELYNERYVVALPPNHKLASHDDIKLSALSQQPYVDRLACELREMVLTVCRERNIELYARFRSEREDWIQTMVCAGIGFAFMPEYSISSQSILQRSLVEPSLSRSICLGTMPGRPFSPATSLFVRAAKAFQWTL